MSLTIHGIGVSGGVAIGHAHLMTHAGLEVPRYDVPPHQAAEESARFDAAIRQVRAEFEVQAQVLLKTREKLEALEKRVAEFEARFPPSST